ncbi:MAG: hypothetical protein CMH61_00550 [Nanoarchaeota archaeon]|nr:hypothetical protein [Nanoarchaeota archaeon]|tara:strand:+ start:4050 stop:4328 length:279 start_codon:yes stop_codon:yes gene_type:complete
MPFPAFKLPKDYEPLRLDERVQRVKTREVPIDLKDSRYLEIYPVIKAEADRLSDMINENRHHDDMVCYMYIFDLMHFIPLLPRKERGKYNKY